MTPAIDVRALTRRFGGFTAVDGITFDVGAGEVFGFLGANGAGKTTAIRMLKFAFNAVDDGMVGQQVFAGEATRLAYGTDEAVEGRDSFLEKRDPDWSPYPWHY